MRLGLREANQRFSEVVRAVKTGKAVVLTDRGRPVAVVRPLQPTRRTEALIRELEARGLLRAATRREPMRPWTPRRLRGRPVAQTLREEREAR